MSENEELLNRSIKLTGLPQYYIYKDIQNKFESYGEIDFVKYGKHDAIIVFKSQFSQDEALKLKQFSIGESIVTVFQAQNLKLSEDDYEFITEEKCQFEEEMKIDENEKDKVNKENFQEKQNEIQENEHKLMEIKLNQEDKYLQMILNFNYFIIVLFAWTLYTFLIKS